MSAAVSAVVATSLTTISSKAVAVCLKKTVSSSFFSASSGRASAVGSIKKGLREDIPHLLWDSPARHRKVAFASPLSLACERRTVCMAAGSEGTVTTYVDHVVFFHVKDDVPPEKAEAMVNGLRNLGECQPPLDGLLQMSCGASLPPSLLNKPVDENTKFPFTHALHSRFRDRASLDAYSASSKHLDVVANLVKPIVDNICAVDWFTDLKSDAVDPDANILHVVLFNLKEGSNEADVKEAVDALKALEDLIPGLRQMSVGENFAPARAQGYTWGLAARFASPEDLVAYSKNRRHQAAMIRALKVIDKFVDLDFATGSGSKL